MVSDLWTPLYMANTICSLLHLILAWQFYRDNTGPEPLSVVSTTMIQGIEAWGCIEGCILPCSRHSLKYSSNALYGMWGCGLAGDCSWSVICECLFNMLFFSLSLSLSVSGAEACVYVQYVCYVSWISVSVTFDFVLLFYTVWGIEKNKSSLVISPWVHQVLEMHCATPWSQKVDVRCEVWYLFNRTIPRAM